MPRRNTSPVTSFFTDNFFLICRGRNFSCLSGSRKFLTSRSAGKVSSTTNEKIINQISPTPSVENDFSVAQSLCVGRNAINFTIYVGWHRLRMSEGSKSSTHYLGDKNRFDVLSKGPSSHYFPTKGLCSKRRICFYRLGSE